MKKNILVQLSIFSLFFDEKGIVTELLVSEDEYKFLKKVVRRLKKENNCDDVRIQVIKIVRRYQSEKYIVENLIPKIHFYC